MPCDGGVRWIESGEVVERFVILHRLWCLSQMHLLRRENAALQIIVDQVRIVPHWTIDNLRFCLPPRGLRRVFSKGCRVRRHGRRRSRLNNIRLVMSQRLMLIDDSVLLLHRRVGHDHSMVRIHHVVRTGARHRMIGHTCGHGVIRLQRSRDTRRVCRVSSCCCCTSTNVDGLKPTGYPWKSANAATTASS